MGFVALLLLGAGAMGLLVLFGVGRQLWSLVGAALMLGAIGYALQGRPLDPGAPAVPAVDAVADDSGLIALRDRLYGRFTGEAAYVVMADALVRSGDSRMAAQAVLSGIRAAPRSVLLWTELGTLLAAHDGGLVSPPALFAFRQATRLSPEHPGPPFFEGLAYVRAGDLAAARPLWARTLALTPRDADYRGEIATRLMLLDRVIAIQERMPPGR